ncbi:MAG TPA: aminotransferase class IV [Gammaproteobacteria bacterium]
MAAFESMTNVDGVITPTAEARVPVMDRGFLYGDSVYEVFRTYDGVPLFYDEHWQRFERSASLVRLRLDISKERMAEEIRRTVHATGAPSSKQDVSVRYTVTRGSGRLDLHPEPDLRNRYVIIVRAAPRWDAQLYSHGIALAIPPTRRNPAWSLDPNVKGGNYLNNVLAVMEARALGADDALMLSDAGLVTEASNSNVFFAIDGVLVTPSQTAANLRGLTKAALHEACRAHGLPTAERDLAVADLTRATECFITSATREVMPVASLRLEDGGVLTFPPGGGPLTRRAAEHYREHVRRYVRDHAALSMF